MHKFNHINKNTKKNTNFNYNYVSYPYSYLEIISQQQIFSLNYVLDSMIDKFYERAI
jgi:hypothetical protein